MKFIFQRSILSFYYWTMLILQDFQFFHQFYSILYSPYIKILSFILRKHIDFHKNSLQSASLLLTVAYLKYPMLFLQAHLFPNTIFLPSRCMFSFSVPAYLPAFPGALCLKFLFCSSRIPPFRNTIPELYPEVHIQMSQSFLSGAPLFTSGAINTVDLCFL